MSYENEILKPLNENISTQTSQITLNKNKLTSEEELIITKCLSSWYDIPKEQMINSLMNIVTQNPNISLIKTIITELVNKLSTDPRELRL